MSRALARIIYVTGKGGAGKTFFASLLAQAAVDRALRPILVSFGDPERSASTAEPAAVAGATPVELDHQGALEGVLTKLLRFKTLSDRLMDSRTFTAVAAAAPGLRDVLYLVAIRDLAERAVAAGHGLIVIDGFASGHSTLLLGAPRRVQRLVRIGRLAREVAAADSLVRDPNRFRVAIVSNPEELSVVEAEELLAQLRELGLPLAPVVLNGLLPQRAGEPQAAWLERHGGSEDARLYIARRRRQLLLTDRLRDAAGNAHIIPFSFAEDPHVASADAGALLDELFEAWR